MPRGHGEPEDQRPADAKTRDVRPLPQPDDRRAQRLRLLSPVPPARRPGGPPAPHHRRLPGEVNRRAGGASGGGGPPPPPAGGTRPPANKPRGGRGIEACARYTQPTPAR